MKVSQRRTSSIRAKGCLRQATRFGLLGLAALQFIFSSRTHGQAPPFEWVRTAGGSQFDHAQSVATDAAGNIYVTGYFQDKATFGTNSFGVPGDLVSRMFIVKLDASANFIWTKTASIGLTCCSCDPAQAVAVDPSGSVYVCGTFHGQVTFGTTSLISDPNFQNLYLVKYSTAGNVVWAIQAGPIYCTPNAIAVGNDGSVHVTGSFLGTATFGNTNITTVNPSDIFHAKYDTAGRFVWVRKAGGASYDGGYAVAVDVAGTSFVAGTFNGPASFGSFALTGHPQSGLDNNSWPAIFVTRYDLDGNVLWARQVSTGYETGAALAAAVDPQGNCYLTGRGFDQFYDGNNTRISNPHIFVAKYDPLGILSWIVRIASNAVQPIFGDNAGYGVASDTAGNCYVTGSFTQTAQFGATNLVSLGDRDIFLAKYSPTGALMWVKQAGLVFQDTGAAVALDANANIYIAGWFTDSADFDADYVTALGAADIFVAKLPAITPVPPAIIIQPQGQTVLAGAEASLDVAAAGTAPLIYQWLFNGTNLPAATKVLLVISNAQPINGGNYTVVVTNNYGAVTSAVATLTVRYSLTINTIGGGTVTRNPDLASYPPNSVVTLTALASAGSAFNFWSGDASGDANPLSVTMTTNKMITANFVSNAVTIVVQGSGSVSKSPDKTFYNVGDQVTLTAVPGRWYAFTRWGDGLTVNPRLITIGASNNYTAIFSPTTVVETLTFSNVTRTAPVGMPAIFVDGNFVVTNSVTRQGGAQIVLQTSFPNGTIFYTLDGSPPTFVATLYAGPFELRRTATIRAAAWNATFSRFWEADPLTVVIQPVYSLNASTRGGGTLVVTPPSGPYVSNTVVFVAETAAGYWSFLGWLGDASGTDRISRIVMTRDKCVEAVFGTTLSTIVAGNGSVALSPDTALYPYGTEVTLTAVPQAGGFFGVWGDAVSSTNNPLRFVVTNGNRTISAAFAPLDAGQFALTVMTSGSGQVTVSPQANIYRQGQRVTLEAAPDAGQEFLGWTGDASGVLTNLLVVMDQSRVFTANFTGRPRLSLGPCLGGLSEDGFQLTLTGEYGARYEIDGSTTLIGWTAVATVTNLFGTVQFTDQTGTNSHYRFYRAILLP